MAKEDAEKPFDGAVSRYVRKDAPKAIRAALEDAGKHDILDPTYPYQKHLDDAAYEKAYAACQLELVRMQRWLRAEGKRIVILFEGRDAAGKGGAIKAIRENLNPRWARDVALAAPSDVERGQWYFQRYVAHLPTRGELVLFDRSWYNRGIVEHVFGWCTDEERERFFRQLPGFEQTLVEDGIILMKVWLAISRAEELRQFLQRESDPLKQWKLSQTDIDGLPKFGEFTKSIAESFRRSHLPSAPWTVVLADDKRRARLATMQAILSRLDYPGKAVAAPDPAICGGPELLAGKEATED
ncbi:MAG: polyphosphate kinase 2 [Amaricoccus sp.]|uniref:polyphosphate kinase 2 n=1 Tax=Amaricoccus sp. TaxID=1872485 RepID=UPI0039E35CB3